MPAVLPRGRWTVVGVLVGMVLLWGVSAYTWAEALSPEDASPQDLVAEALFREVYGLNRERGDLLARALRVSPDYAPAFWHSGCIRFDGRWTTPEEAGEQLASDAVYQQYLRVREDYLDTADGQLALARWCECRGLDQQCRAHLNRVLQFDRNHRLARQLLGHRRVGEEWMSPRESREIRRDEAQRNRDLTAWRARLRSLLNRLEQPGSLPGKAAQRQWEAIDDAAAVPAMESMLAFAGPREAELLLLALARIPDRRAAEALVRTVAYSGNVAVAMAVENVIDSRPLEEFVPPMLAALSTPVQSTTQIVPGDEDGWIVHQQVFSRETYGIRHETVYEIAAREQRQPPVAANDSSTATRWFSDWRQRQVDSLTAEREGRWAEQNEAIRSENARLCSALTLVTGQDLPAAPEVWWSWWDDRMGYRSYEKPIEQTYERVTLSTSCFAAGTPVWTPHGLKPIETVRVGDLVVAQDPVSGELALKAVVNTTVREPIPLVRVTAADESLDCTPNHAFWISGNGWVPARQLGTGAALHTTVGTAVLTAVEAGPTELTHNLVIADFHTYFVGRSKILVHDITHAEDLCNIVPGLSAW